MPRGRLWAVALFAVALLSIAASAQRLQAAKQLKACLNRHQPNKGLSTWDSVLSDEMAASVPVAGVWWSKRAPAVPMTIITQLTLDRVAQLYSQCKSWAGPISAVLYVALDYSPSNPSQATNESARQSPTAALRAAVQQASEFHSMAERELSCQLDLLLAYEKFSDSNGTALLYPVNILRNYARLQARTSLIGLFDADMLPSHTLFEELQDPLAVRRLQALVHGSPSQAPALLVLPAFITYDAGNHSAEQIADSMVHTRKQVLTTMWENEVINRFDPKDKGHNATQYSRWLNATEQYEVRYELRYEPWVICDRLLVPWYDARFRGYGMNKIVHIEHMNQTGHRFVVHPTAWLIHRRHPLGQAKLQHLRDFTELQGAPASDRYHTIYGHSVTLGRRIQAELSEGHYMTVVDKATAQCSSRLPWWHQNHWHWQASQSLLRQVHVAARNLIEMLTKAQINAVDK